MGDINKIFRDFDNVFHNFDTMWDKTPPMPYIKRWQNGTYTVDVPGFEQDDLTVTIESRFANFSFKNDDRTDLSFDVQIPRSTSDINVAVDKGVLTFTIQHKPSDISVNFGKIDEKSGTVKKPENFTTES